MGEMLIKVRRKTCRRAGERRLVVTMRRRIRSGIRRCRDQAAAQQAMRDHLGHVQETWSDGKAAP